MMDNTNFCESDIHLIHFTRIYSAYNCFLLVLHLIMNYNLIAGASVVNPKYQPATKHVTKHQEASKPAWLLALEIVTGTMVGSLFIIAILTAIQRCNNKSSIIIPWKKSASGKDYMAVHIGLCLFAFYCVFSIYY